jgi:toxin-antitoxin system PIN domain toxin
VILVDANLLVYAVNADAPEFPFACAWLEDVLNGPDRIGMPWATLLAFVRLSANPNVLRHPVSTAVAWRRVEDEWLSRRNVWIPEPGPDHGAILRSLFSRFAIGARKVSDAHLAAMAIEHGLTLCSSDGDFANVPGLKWRNPLRAATLHEDAPDFGAAARTGTPASRTRRR